MATSKTLRTLIVLFVGALLIAAGYPYLARLTTGKPIPSPLPFPTAFPLLFGGILPTDITRIYVQDAETGRSITLVKNLAEWTATDETGTIVEVDPNQIIKMISILPTLQYNRSMNESNLTDFGLANGGEFIVQFDADRSHTLRIGAISADGSLSYVQRDNETAVLWVPVQPVANLVALVASPKQGTGTPETPATLAYPTVVATTAANISSDSMHFNLSP